MNIIENFYRSFLGRIMSLLANLLVQFLKPRMIYGVYNKKQKKFNKYTRISSTAVVLNKSLLNIGNYVWVWHHSILDATEGLTIEDGCQIGAWVGIFTHGSEISIRLLGQQFVHIPNKERIGYTRGSVEIGEYSFVGAGSIILPGCKIGKGCIIGANTIINRDIPQYSIAIGSPAKIVGTVHNIDSQFIAKYPEIKNTYFDKLLYDKIMFNDGYSNKYD